MPGRLCSGAKAAALLLGLSGLLIPGSAQAIDLTPRFSEITVGGVVQRRMFFLDGERKISLNPDFQTRVEAGAGGAVFRFQRIPNSMVILRHSPISPDEPFSGVSLLRYKEAAHRLLPPNVTSVDSLEEVAEPVTNNGWHSYRFAVTYVDQGIPRIGSVTFINLNSDEQIVMFVTAPANDFEDAQERAGFMLRTWHVLPPDPPAATPAPKPGNPSQESANQESDPQK